MIVTEYGEHLYENDVQKVACIRDYISSIKLSKKNAI
jgi:hypothetical protein